MAKTYKIIRSFEDPAIRSRIIAEGLSIEEAIEHVTGTEASSDTACNSLGKARTRRCGRWFDSYKEE